MCATGTRSKAVNVILIKKKKCCNKLLVLEQPKISAYIFSFSKIFLLQA